MELWFWSLDKNESWTFLHSPRHTQVGLTDLISEKSIWKNQVWRTRFLVYFELDFYWLKIRLVELDFYNLIFQKSRTDQQGERHVEVNHHNYYGSLTWTFIAGLFTVSFHESTRAGAVTIWCPLRTTLQILIIATTSLTCFKHGTHENKKHQIQPHFHAFKEKNTKCCT